MRLIVPTVTCEAVITREFDAGDKKFAVGEIASLPYGLVLQLKAMGFCGAIKDEIQAHAEAAEALKIYGGDAWFPHRMQTISRVGDYLAARGEADTVN